MKRNRTGRDDNFGASTFIRIYIQQNDIHQTRFIDIQQNDIQHSAFTKQTFGKMIFNKMTLIR